MTLNKIRIFVLICGVVFSGRLTFAQEKDNQLWTNAVIKLKVNKQLRFDLEGQTRFNNYITHMNYVITEAGALYELNKHFNVRLNLRYYYDPESHNKYRYSGDFSYEWSKKGFPLGLKYRLRFQQTIEEHTHNTDTYFRNKFMADYNLSKLVDPFLGYESYLKLSSINKFTVNRYLVGLEWRVTKDLDLSTYFMFENEFGEKKPKENRIYGIELSYSFKL